MTYYCQNNQLNGCCKFLHNWVQLVKEKTGHKSSGYIVTNKANDFWLTQWLEAGYAEQIQLQIPCHHNHNNTTNAAVCVHDNVLMPELQLTAVAFQQVLVVNARKGWA